MKAYIKFMLRVIFLILPLFFNNAFAEKFDICTVTLVNITSLSDEYNCFSWGSFFPPKLPDEICYFNALCCTPLVCKVTHACGLARTITNIVTNAGDLHCFDNITASELFEKWKNKQIALAFDVLTLGQLELLMQIVKQDINAIANMGVHLPLHAQKILEAIIAPGYDDGKTGYSYEDIKKIKIINRSRNWNTKLWVKKSAITLGPVVILSDAHYKELTDFQNMHNLTDLVNGKDSLYADAIIQMVHELVHVKQFRELGQETFFKNYIVKNLPWITKGYGHGAFEQEAYRFDAAVALKQGGDFCAVHIQDIISNSNSYNLGLGSISCNPGVGALRITEIIDHLLR